MASYHNQNPIALNTVTLYSAEETLVLIQNDLHRQYPETHFSLEVKEFTAGSSIHVRWQDGPKSCLIGRQLRAYEATYPGRLSVNNNGQLEMINFGVDVVICLRAKSN